MGKIKRQSIKSPKDEEYIKEMNRIRKEKLKKCFKKIGNAVLFIAFLKRYNKKNQSWRIIKKWIFMLL